MRVRPHRLLDYGKSQQSVAMLSAPVLDILLAASKPDSVLLDLKRKALGFKKEKPLHVPLMFFTPMTAATVFILNSCPYKLVTFLWTLHVTWRHCDLG